MIYSAEDGVLIRSAEETDAEQVLALANERFGDGYITIETVQEWLKHPDLFIIAEYEGRFVSYLVSTEETADEIAESFKLERDYVRALAGGMPVCHAKSAATVKECEHMGLMHKMFRPMLDNAKAHGYKIGLASAWKYNGKIPIAKVFNSYGFEPICERENLWYDIPNYKCVICGDRCTCTAVIYKYEF